MTSNSVAVIRYQYDNHLGSASLELDENAEIISYEEYHPFGTTSYRSGRTETETSQKRYKYVGKERDEETGLYYYGFRYYAAWLCRFVSVDPLQFDYPHYTPFQYAGNKPISYIDLDGLEETKPILYHNTQRVNKIINEGFNATKYGKKSNYNWFTLENNNANTGRKDFGNTLKVEGIEIKNAQVITKSQTKGFSAEAMKEMGYTKETWKEASKKLSKEDFKKLEAERRGRMWSKVGKYMDDKGKDIYITEVDGNYAISDKVANQSGVKVTSPSGKTNLKNKDFVKTLAKYGKKTAKIGGSAAKVYSGAIEIFSTDPLTIKNIWIGADPEYAKEGQIYLNFKSFTYYVITGKEKIYKEGELIKTIIKFEFYEGYEEDEETGNYIGTGYIGSGEMSINHETNETKKLILS